MHVWPQCKVAIKGQRIGVYFQLPLWILGFDLEAMAFAQ